MAADAAAAEFFTSCCIYYTQTQITPGETAIVAIATPISRKHQVQQPYKKPEKSRCCSTNPTYLLHQPYTAQPTREETVASRQYHTPAASTSARTHKPVQSSTNLNNS